MGRDHNDEIIYDLTPGKTSASGYGHALCKGKELEVAEEIILASSALGQGHTMNVGHCRAFGRNVACRVLPAAAAIVLAAWGARADQPSLRVCADPNNLPFSNSAEAVENKIVKLIADHLGRPLEYVWRAQRRGFVREGLNAGECDLVAAIPSGAPMALTTRPYYRSTYVFLSKPRRAAGFIPRDPSLRTLKIGVRIGDNGVKSPLAHALLTGDRRERAWVHGLWRLP